MKLKLLAKESGQISNLVSISMVEIFSVLGFSVKRQKNLFTFEAFCIILANSFFNNCLTCVKCNFCNKKVNKLSLKISNLRRDYHFQTEVDLNLLGNQIKSSLTSRNCILLLPESDKIIHKFLKYLKLWARLVNN